MVKSSLYLSIKKTIFCVILIFVLSFAFALNVPHLSNPVVDNAHVINSSDEEWLNKTLSELSKQTGIQIGVLTIPSLEGEDLEDFSMKVAEDWQLGQKGEDLGALLVVSINDRSLRIETGYGLEGSLTDTKSGMIIRNVITPKFKEGNYSKGIAQGVNAIVQTVAPDFVGSESKIDYANSDDDDSVFALVPFVFFLFFTVVSIFGSNRRRYGRNYKNNTLNTIIGAKILSDVLNSTMRSNSRSSGFGGFGGFSGGGGGFGGGGASGSW